MYAHVLASLAPLDISFPSRDTVQSTLSFRYSRLPRARALQLHSVSSARTLTSESPVVAIDDSELWTKIPQAMFAVHLRY